MHYNFTTVFSIDSIMEMEKKNYPQVYIEECKYKIKKKKVTGFIGAELDFDESDDFDSE